MKNPIFDDEAENEDYKEDKFTYGEDNLQHDGEDVTENDDKDILTDDIEKLN